MAMTEAELRHEDDLHRIRATTVNNADVVAERVSALEAQLSGDDGIAAALTKLTDAIDTIMNSLETMGRVVDISQPRIEFIRKLELHFGAAVDGVVFGDQIATKAYVDAGLARLAGALRSERVKAPKAKKVTAKKATKKRR